jgi:DNA invertase Pin-like site-specific DNA recombinase
MIFRLLGRGERASTPATGVWDSLTTMAKAVSYLRVSGKGQVDGDGFPRQRDTIARYVRTHGVDVVGEYRDEGVSGTRDLDDREGLGELIERIRANGVRLVLVERADRLARDLLVSEVLLAQFRDLGVRVVAADSGTDLTAADEDPTRVLIRQVLGAVAQFEKSVIVAKLADYVDADRRGDAKVASRSVSIPARSWYCIASGSCVASPAVGSG